MSDRIADALETRLAALDLVARQLALLDRSPFRALLTELIGAKPTPAALSAFAEKHPDRWAQAVSMMAGLAGFERGVNVNFNVFNVRAMSDAELLAEHTKLGLGRVIDVTPSGQDGSPSGEPAPAPGSAPDTAVIVQPSAPGGIRDSGNGNVMGGDNEPEHE